MSNRLASGRYLENEVLSRSKEWLVPLLYEHLLSALRRAKVCIEVQDHQGRAECLTRANTIVLELVATLDMEQGGEIASRLAALYAFYATEILAIGRSRDQERLERLTSMAAELHEAWVEAAEQVAPRERAGGVKLALSA